MDGHMGGAVAIMLYSGQCPSAHFPRVGMAHFRHHVKVLSLTWLKHRWSVKAGPELIAQLIAHLMRRLASVVPGGLLLSRESEVLLHVHTMPSIPPLAPRA